ncbi:DUF5694 domain-containing protein [Jeotgalicoccus sp. WY2]|uniref:DUF5694 domain-containing protein n=1 Tax=Jeotgalicoccus sp. WY2 TaxID=2708346 RepID=UPI0035304B54
MVVQKKYDYTNHITQNLNNNDKVMVIVGSGHIYILKQLLEASNNFNVITFYDWTKKNNMGVPHD